MDFIRLYIKPNDTKFYESKINLDGDPVWTYSFQIW